MRVRRWQTKEGLTDKEALDAPRTQPKTVASNTNNQQKVMQAGDGVLNQISQTGSSLKNKLSKVLGKVERELRPTPIGYYTSSLLAKPRHIKPSDEDY